MQYGRVIVAGMRRLKVGVIGLGEAGQIIHLPILQQLASKFEIAALCDISKELLFDMGNRYQVANLYTDAKKLTEQPDLDAVLIVNSDEYHAECAVWAATGGKHALIEKPLALSVEDTNAVIRARDRAGVHIMVGYMRRFAPAFIQAVEEVKRLPNIRYARIRDIIGQNRLMIEQTSTVRRYHDISPEAMEDRRTRASSMMKEALGEVPQTVMNSYRLLCGLNSHDFSAMREILGVPKRVIAAAHWNDGYSIAALLEFEGFCATFETLVDNQRRFDAHIEVYSDSKSIKIQYDTGYIRHLPTIMEIRETVGEAFRETNVRPTYKDPYTHELEYFYDVVTQNARPKTTPEDYKEDLKIFKMIIEAIMEGENGNESVQR